MRRRHFLAAAAPAVLAAACAPQAAMQTISVFFTADSATLDAEAQAVVRAAADRAKSTTGPIVVVGFAGPAGGAAYNRALSEQRAQHVADLLISSGLPRERVRVVARGPVPFESVATESRRVEIRAGG
ncbi:OmpA family protein [Roseomonas sp. CECT 9278]|uniref:OmpA family protein n=1 Tax=Roseomonas sp. CECT 9278 TaxID=2845823 RepID=UPI001E295619|nr:OmpA family protein [Roseomonas sp. CECT 9278]CAH0168271.1 Peptidoglycan-associated lipoprotein [Roseomonas sp. CECT 9278]